MAERRPLIDGLVPALPLADPDREKAFVFGPKAVAAPPPTPPEPVREPPRSPAAPPRVSITTRIRGDYVAALKRASLERQLAGTEPHTVQDFLEEALEPWLKANGLLGGPP